MHERSTLHRFRKPALFSALLLFSLCLIAGHFYLYAQDKSAFPDGFDAVQAAPNSHKVVFENALVRVLEVTIPPPGKTEPMHHHRWPGFFLSWDTGGATPHVRYHRADGSVVDQPSVMHPIHPGVWTIKWMKPEPLHAIEVISRPPTRPDKPPLLRIELKFAP